MKDRDILQLHANMIKDALPTIAKIEAVTEIRSQCKEAIKRQYFKPEEEAMLQTWFSDFLRTRQYLWYSIRDLQALLDNNYLNPTETQKPFLLVGFCAACLLVRIDFFLIKRVATHSIIQRKLNESVRSLKIPRKQFTEVFRSLSSIPNARHLNKLMLLFRENAQAFDHLNEHEIAGYFVENLASFQAALDPSKKNFSQLYLSYRIHAFQRRATLILNNSFFWLLKWSGRFFSEIYDQWSAKQVTPEIRNTIADILESGDIIATRHKNALTNVLLPGFWPHTALYVGTNTYDDSIIDAGVLDQWYGSACVLEARKDGVHFRPLYDTLKVDAFVILRPKLTEDEKLEAIRKVSLHAGKGYNFDFDFFGSDRLVCTEVIYRAYDQVGNFNIELAYRGGRPTLSAEDLIKMAWESDKMEAIACFGFNGCDTEICTDKDKTNALIQSSMNIR
jgi:uncharacterized protein YycO